MSKSTKTARTEIQSATKKSSKRLPKKFYEKELERLQFELVKWQYWIKERGLRVVITFDGRDAAGKGGIIKRMMQPMQPRGLRLIALPQTVRP